MEACSQNQQSKKKKKDSNLLVAAWRLFACTHADARYLVKVYQVDHKCNRSLS